MKLSDITTIRTGGEAKHFFDVKTLGELKRAVGFAKKNGLRVIVIGEGSNVLVTDDLIENVVVRLGNKDIKESVLDNGVRVRVGGGMKWDEFVKWTVDRNYQGVECLSYIPGLVGAAPVQNIGAYGTELSDIFIELEAYDVEKDEIVSFDKNSIEFGYRDSIFKKPKNKGRYIIFSVTFLLTKGGKPAVEYESLKDYLDKQGVKKPTIAQVRDAVITIRKMRLEDPEVKANAGSFFKNPKVGQQQLQKLMKDYPDIPNYPEKDGGVKLSAGWLVEKGGWKGKRLGNVAVSDKHALVIVNPEGKGSTKEILELSGNIIDDIESKFGVRLEREVTLIE